MWFFLVSQWYCLPEVVVWCDNDNIQPQAQGPLSLPLQSHTTSILNSLSLQLCNIIKTEASGLWIFYTEHNSLEIHTGC